jgi:SAM-dependent methyltransferase
LKYESGDAERDAAAVPGPHSEPWLNVLAANEPGSPVALRQAVEHPVLGPRIRGRVIVLGAGTCWATAELSRLERVEQVTAVDLSAGFLRRVGSRMVSRLGEPAKVRLVASSFEAVPLPPSSFDVAFLIAALHHSLAPIKLLLEARRLLLPGGLLIVVESPATLLGIRRRRRHGLALSRETGATEIAYTRGEIDYLLAHAGFARRRWLPAGPLSPHPIKRLLRWSLRQSGLEPLLGSVSYLIAAEREPEPA